MMGRRKFKIECKTTEQLAIMRRAGLVVAATLATVRETVRPGVTTESLDRVAVAVIRDSGATPSFLGYHGYPATLCVSVDDEVVHGIPGPRVLREGQLVSIDCGAIVDGWHGDAAISVPVGQLSDELADLSRATETALWAGLEAAVPGARLSDIGAAVEASVAAQGRGYGIVVDYVGHGIGRAMHERPNVPNVGPGGKGPLLEPGMTFAIEPMITLGSNDVDVLDDDWTVVTSDGTPAAHWEHTVAVTESGPWILTAQDG